MNNRNLLVKIIKFALIVGSPFMGNRLLAEDLKICSENLPELGMIISKFDNDPDIYTVIKKISIKKALNNEDLQIHIALLKFEAVRKIVEFIGTELDGKGRTRTKYYLDEVQTVIAFMKGKYICIKKGSSKDEIFFIGEWSPESIKRGSKILQYHRVHAE